MNDKPFLLAIIVKPRVLTFFKNLRNQYAVSD